jgi:hypothetical protein
MARRCFRLIARTFRQKIPFHLQLANVPVELVNAKQPRSALQQRPFPGVNLAEMDFKSAGQLGNGLVSLQRGQGYLGLEGWAMLLTCLLHVPAPPFP